MRFPYFFFLTINPGIFTLGREITIRRTTSEKGLRSFVPDRTSRRILHPEFTRIRRQEIPERREGRFEHRAIRESEEEIRRTGEDLRTALEMVEGRFLERSDREGDPLATLDRFSHGAGC